MRLRPFAALFVLLLLSQISFSQAVAVPAKQMATPPKIDGVIDPKEWEGVPTFSGFSDRLTNIAEPEKSEFWIGYDAKYIYFAARLEDKSPKAIIATEYRSNVNFPGDDSVSLQIDPFGRTGNYSRFTINPRGATGMQIAGGRAAKREWIGEFLAAGRVTPTGWEVEARIPWGVMQLPAPGIRELSFNVSRYDPRLGRNYVWRYSSMSTDSYGRWIGVDVPRSGNKRKLELLPYLYGGYDRSTGRIANAGLDMKTSLTDQVALVGSVNPDFRNVENNILSLDFSHFERLAAETRPFFLEGQQYFGTSIDAPLFTPQRISDFDVGMKTYGVLSPKMNVAVLDAASFGKQNSSVADVTYRINPDTTFTGAYAGLEKEGLSNQGTFFSVIHNRGPMFVFAQHEETQDSIEGYGHRINAGGGYNKNGLSFDTEYLEISSKFLPRLGFAPETDLRGYFVNTGVDRRFNRGSISELGYGLKTGSYYRFNGDQYRREHEANVACVLKNGLGAMFDADYQRFLGSDDVVYDASVGYPANNTYTNVGLEYTFGHITGIRYQSLKAAGAYRAKRNVQFTYAFQTVEYLDKQRQSIVGVNWDLSKDTALSGRFVRQNHDTNAYLAYRKSGYSGVEYYVILGDPNAQTFHTALVVKLIVPFQINLR